MEYVTVEANEGEEAEGRTPERAEVRLLDALGDDAEAEDLGLVLGIHGQIKLLAVQVGVASGVDALRLEGVVKHL